MITIIKNNGLGPNTMKCSCGEEILVPVSSDTLKKNPIARKAYKAFQKKHKDCK